MGVMDRSRPSTRNASSLVKIEKVNGARQMQRPSRRACHVTDLAREQDLPLKPGLIAMIERYYGGVLANGSGFHDAARPDKSRTARPYTATGRQ
jgi:hypothetical protein